MWRAWLASLAASMLLQAASGEPRPVEDELSRWGNGSSWGHAHPGLRRESCETAQLKCAVREGCGAALQDYMMGCSFMLSNEPMALKYCPEPCQHALIALTSTEEGKGLMNCRCTESSCELQKRRAEVCRPQVEEAIRDVTVVSCRVAEWICAADPLCSKALEYYHRFCKAMFQGKKCSFRCNNSLSILLRQEKAAKLATCVCDGRENYNCRTMRDNMRRLCQLKLPGGEELHPESNEVPGSSATLVSTSAAAALASLFLPYLTLRLTHLIT